MEILKNETAEVVDAGIEKIPIVIRLKDLLSEKGFVMDQTNVESEEFKELESKLRKVFGYEDADIVPIHDGARHLLAVTTPLYQGISIVSIIDKEYYSEDKEMVSKGVQDLEVEDVLFVSTETGKSISFQDTLPDKVRILFDQTLKTGAFAYVDYNTRTDQDLQEQTTNVGKKIFLPVPGRYAPPIGIIDRAIWNTIKMIEPIIWLHEARHTEQSKDTATDTTLRERDSWYYALRQYRRIRDQGLDLLPEAENHQILSRIEIALATYKFNEVGETEGLVAKLIKLSQILTTSIPRVVRKINRDPSITKDTFTHRGREHLKPTRLKDLLEME